MAKNISYSKIRERQRVNELCDQFYMKYRVDKTDKKEKDTSVVPFMVEKQKLSDFLSAGKFSLVSVISFRTSVNLMYSSKYNGFVTGGNDQRN